LSLKWLLIPLHTFEVLCTLRVGAWFFYSPSHSNFLYMLQNFLLCVAHQLGPLSSFSFWLDSLHLWLAPRSIKDLLSFLLPWWGMDRIPQCHLGCFYIHHERHGVSCFVWANSCPSTTFPSIFLLTTLHGVINWWHLHNGQCDHCQSHLNKFGFTCYFFLWVGCYGGELSKNRTLPLSTPNKCISSHCHKGFWLLAPTNGRFFHQCANMAWSAKNIGGLFLVVLWAFYRWRMLTILQRM
jgi:hypothetical protein